MNELLNEHIAEVRERLRESMSKAGADGCLLSVDVNLIYMTGHLFNGYYYLPLEGDPWLFVKRPNGMEGERVAYIRKPEQMAELFSAHGIPMPAKLLLEGDELTYADYIRLAAVFPSANTLNATPLLRNLRCVKTDWELSQFRQSAALHAKTYGEIRECFHPGMTDVAFQAEIERRMRLNGSMGLFRTFGANMDIFMGSILAGENAENASPFDFALGGGGVNDTLPIGANGTILTDGTAVMVDMAGNYTPYMTDMTRAFAVGQLPGEAYRAHQVALAIQSEIERTARPGTPCAELYNIALAIAQKEGLADCFMGTRQQAGFVGHGIGLQINELPVLAPRSKEILAPRMVFALEPKFVIPGVGAVGIENSFLVTETGVEKLTIFPEEIIQLL